MKRIRLPIPPDLRHARPHLLHMSALAHVKPPLHLADKDLTMTYRPSPSDILLAILSVALLLASGLVAGGLAAHPFAL